MVKIMHYSEIIEFLNWFFKDDSEDVSLLALIALSYLLKTLVQIWKGRWKLLNLRMPQLLSCYALI